MRSIPSANIVVALFATIGLSLIVSLGLAANAEEAALKEQVIVMHSGRVMTGRMTRNAGGWLAEQGDGTGRVQIPEDQVKVVADSLVEAYRLQRDRIVDPTPATHLHLARWCVSYRLNGEARSELQSCLKRDPNNIEAHRLLRRVDEMLSPKPAELPGISLPTKTSEGFVRPEVESLGGLSKETATQFTARIQPLLLNKCGNANCHGAASKNELQLHANRPGSSGHRLYTERNLAEVLRYIDTHDPARSALLTVTQGSHAGANAVFNGPQGSEQAKTLRNWIKAVSRERMAEEQEMVAAPTVVTTKKSLADSKRTRKQTMAKSEFGGMENESKTPRRLTSAQSNRRVPNQVAVATNSDELPLTGLETEESQTEVSENGAPQRLSDFAEDGDPEDSADDFFDPSIFNRRFHGESSAKK